MQLKETLTRAEEELSEKDRLIDKYQLEIRQRNDEIEKKVFVFRSSAERYRRLTHTIYVCISGFVSSSRPSWTGPDQTGMMTCGSAYFSSHT